MKNEIINKLIKIVYDLTAMEIDEDFDLKLNGIDSLTLVSLIVAIEEEFRISFEDDDLDPNNLKTLKNIKKIMEKYV